MASRVWLSTLFLACGSASCASNARWTFHLTEKFYLDGSGGGGGAEGTYGNGWEGTSGDEQVLGQMAVFVVGLLLVPVAIDVVCLPVAVPHDIWFRE